MTLDETSLLLARLGAAYPRWAPSEETCAVYAEGLADIPVADAQEGAREWIRGHKFPPTVAELREVASESRRARLERGAGARPVLGSGSRMAHPDQVEAYRRIVARFADGAMTHAEYQAAIELLERTPFPEDGRPEPPEPPPSPAADAALIGRAAGRALAGAPAPPPPRPPGDGRPRRVDPSGFEL